MFNKQKIKLILLLSILSFSSFAEIVKYTLTIENATVAKAGIPVDFALTVNGGIPAPTLKFTEGDDAEITVINKSKAATSVHWHGILLPWQMDGVPFLNTKPVAAGGKFTFKFHVRQHGTYWYHSHTDLDEQRGVYGSIIIDPKEKTIDYDYDQIVQISDWTNTDPMKVLARLKKGEYYAWKKGTVANWKDAIKEGAGKDFLKLRWNRMGGVDLGDVGYDAVLINGQQKSRTVKELRAGDKVRLRVINSGASTYFNFQLGKQKLKVISSDGMNVKPVLVDKVLIGMGETYDVLFTVPEDNMAYEFKATAQDGSGSTSLILGDSLNIEKAPMIMKPSLYKMQMDGMDMGSKPQMDMNKKMPMPKTKTLNYKMLRSVNKTSFDKSIPRTEFKMALGGDMERYVWWINNKLMSEADVIEIKEGNVIRFVLENKTMMHHPMHLHGHFFRVLTKMAGMPNMMEPMDAPLKHTVDVAPGQTIVMEFLANEPGQWIFHCHNLYHVKMGMGRVVRYLGFEAPKTPIKEYLENQKNLVKMVKKDQKMYPSSDISVLTTGIDYNIRMNGGRYEIELEGEITEAKIKQIEGQIYLKRYLNKYTTILTGFEYGYNSINPLIGMSYRAPMDVELVGYITSDKKIVFDVVKRVQVTSRIAFEGTVRATNQDPVTYGVKAQYRLNQNTSLEANCSGDFGNSKTGTCGAGFNFKF